MIPFRSQPAPPSLPEGYSLVINPDPDPAALNALLVGSGDRPRQPQRWQRVLERSIWHLGVYGPGGQLVGFVRATSDLALNANLWDLCCHQNEPDQPGVLAVLVHAALGRLRRELSGCSISLSAAPMAVQPLEHFGFVVDPGGIRAMGLALKKTPPADAEGETRAWRDSNSRPSEPESDALSN